MKNLKTQLSVTVLPPDIVGDVTDEEMIEEDLIPINDMILRFGIAMAVNSFLWTTTTEARKANLQTVGHFWPTKMDRKCNANKQFDFQLKPDAEPLKITQKKLRDERNV
ncbi:hypothetical protein QE152_g30065 [Popillia japonica]|uniref:Uncharacterized protein n=1 Tax=Popillia japonica TaxID=7064 RepID=A0AAW1JEX5_POPJA